MISHESPNKQTQNKKLYSWTPLLEHKSVVFKYNTQFVFCPPLVLTEKHSEKGKREGESSNSSWSGGTLYAGDWGVLDFWVRQVMGEIVSAAELINRSAGSIYLCLRQSCWEMGAPKWESTACFSSPRSPSGHFTPTTFPLESNAWGEADKYKASRELPASALCISPTILEVILMYFVQTWGKSDKSASLAAKFLAMYIKALQLQRFSF